MTTEQLTGYYQRQTEQKGERVIESIDALIADLRRYREGVQAWMNGEPSPTRLQVYGNRLVDVADELADFRTTATAAAMLREAQEDES